MSLSHTPNWVSRLCVEVQNGRFPADLTEERFNDVLKWLLEREFIVGKSIRDAMLQAYDSESNARQNTFLALDDYLFILSEDSPYAILGLTGNSDMAAVKARYRRLIQLYHPDRGLAEANGLSNRAENINQSYDRIKSGSYTPQPARPPAYRNTPRTSMSDKPAPGNVAYRAQASDSIRLVLGSSKRLTLIVMSVLFLSAVLLIYIVYSNNRPIDYSNYNESIYAKDKGVPEAIPDPAGNSIEADLKLSIEKEVDTPVQIAVAAKDPALKQQDTAAEKDSTELNQASEPETRSSSPLKLQVSQANTPAPDVFPKPENLPDGQYSEILAQAEADFANLGTAPGTLLTAPAPEVPGDREALNIRKAKQVVLPSRIQTAVVIPAPRPEAKVAIKPRSKPKSDAPAPVSSEISEPEPAPTNEPDEIDIKVDVEMEMEKIAHLAKVLSTPAVPASNKAPEAAAPLRIEKLTSQDRKQAISALKGYVNGMLEGDVSRSLKYMDNIVQVDGKPNSKKELRQSYSHWLDEAIDRTFKIKVLNVTAHDGGVRITGKANIRFRYNSRNSMGYQGPMTFDVQPTSFGSKIVAITYD